MREVKFRVWDKIAKEMVYPEWETAYVGGTELSLYTYTLNDSFNHSSLSWVLHQPEFEVMQYTGGKDDYANKIWESDICTAEYRCDVCFDSEPHLLIGTIEQEDNGLWMFDYGHGAMPLDLDDLQNIKVIGNIHEKPELLK